MQLAPDQMSPWSENVLNFVSIVQKARAIRSFTDEMMRPSFLTDIAELHQYAALTSPSFFVCLPPPVNLEAGCGALQNLQ